MPAAVTDIPIVFINKTPGSYYVCYQGQQDSLRNREDAIAAFRIRFGREPGGLYIQDGSVYMATTLEEARLLFTLGKVG